MPLGTEKISLLAAAGGGSATNYFGDESDGALTTSGDVTYTVLNKVGSYDGDMVVKQYSALTISTGDTVTVDQVNRGLFIYVTGDCTINGTLSMRKKGGCCSPTSAGGSDSETVQTDGLQLGLRTASGSDTFTNDGTGFNGSGTAVKAAIANEEDIAGDGTIFSINRTTGAGGYGPHDGATGAAAIGSGGGGGYSSGGGGCFSGGAGNGGTYNHPARPGSAYGCAGGNGAGGSDLNGGSGNPGGAGYGGGANGEEGTGGLIWLVVKGDVTVGASGIIETVGGYTGHNYSNGTGGNGGGGSGGGPIHILHGGTYTNGGTVTGAGGIGPGGTGGAGGFNSAQVAAG